MIFFCNNKLIVILALIRFGSEKMFLVKKLKISESKARTATIKKLS